VTLKNGRYYFGDNPSDFDNTNWVFDKIYFFDPVKDLNVAAEKYNITAKLAN